MEEHNEVNWSSIARKAFSKQLKKIEIAESIASESELTEKKAKEIGEKVKEDMAKKHGLVS